MTFQQLEELYTLACTARIKAGQAHHVSELLSAVEAHLNEGRLKALEQAKKELAAE